MACFGYCSLSCIPLRRGPDLSSEMISQVLFAEAFEVLERSGSFAKVRLGHDSYEGWLDWRQATEVDPEEYRWLVSEERPRLVSGVTCRAGVGDRLLTLLCGTVLPGYGGDRFVLPGGLTGWVDGEVVTSKSWCPAAFQDIVAGYLHAPYLWGGRSPLGIDCSGLVQMVYRRFGVALPRDCVDQRTVGDPINSLSQAEVGDLVFFASALDESDHVGLVMPEGQVAHASGCVRIDRLDEEGIVRSDTGHRSHLFREVRRMR